MPFVEDREYFGRRASQSRAQADRTLDPQARAIYLDLAARYERALGEARPAAPAE